jgi:ribose transport system permease protein
MPVPIIIFIFVVVIAWGILTQTRLGRYTYAIGGNEETVRLSGINAPFFKNHHLRNYGPHRGHQFADPHIPA